jgi:SAM-dependent methyltransferase
MTEPVFHCRHCRTPLHQTFIDLGFAPPSNAYRTAADRARPETYYPLRVRVCDRCWLVQTEDYADAGELFSADYAYFSSTSTTWLAHAERYVRETSALLALDRDSFVIEIAANDGYLLKHFVAAGIPCLGIEPTASTAAAAERLGIPIQRAFFGEALATSLAASGRQADLIIGNNVYAHVPDINDFTRGLKAALKPRGTITLEFPHLQQLIQHNQFDTIYHEHFSYLSLTAVSTIMASAGLRIWRVDTLPTHGGSLRVYACHDDDARATTPSVAAVLASEVHAGLQALTVYQRFQQCAETIRDDLLLFLIAQKRAGKRVAGYGAAAKGNTLLNFAGIKPDLLAYVCDKAEAKQGKWLPGSHIPIVAPAQLLRQRPDIVLILPWNIADEVCRELAAIGVGDVRYVTAIPQLVVQ